MSASRLEPAAGRIALANRFKTSLFALVDDVESHAEAIAILAFYRALHLVDAMFLARKGRAPMQHGERGTWLARDVKLKDLKREYDPLFEAAYVARYLTYTDRRTAVPSFFDYHKPADVVSALVEGRLKRLEEALSKLLSAPLLARMQGR